MANPSRVPKAILEARGSSLAASRVDAPTIPGAPEAPAWLAEDAKPFWDEMVALMHKDVPAKQDSLHIAMVAEAFADYERAKEIIAQEGELTTAQSGAVYPHPAVGMKNKAYARIIQGLAKLGMNPSDRSNVAVQPEANKGKVGKFLGVA